VQPATPRGPDQGNVIIIIREDYWHDSKLYWRPTPELVIGPPSLPFARACRESLSEISSPCSSSWLWASRTSGPSSRGQLRLRSRSEGSTRIPRHGSKLAGSARKANPWADGNLGLRQASHRQRRGEVRRRHSPRQAFAGGDSSSHKRRKCM
jgi:hypothetical protein